MTKTPWTKFYWSDWIAGTRTLTPTQRGVYIDILALIYESGGAVKLDVGKLARFCGMPSAAFKRALDALIDDGKLVSVGGEITNLRAEAELNERQNDSNRRRVGAHKTNAAKAEKAQQKQRASTRSASRSAHALPEARIQNPEKEKNTKKEKSVGRMRYPPDFEHGWQTRPRRDNDTNKRKCFEEWQRLNDELREAWIIGCEAEAQGQADGLLDRNFQPDMHRWTQRQQFTEYVDFEDEKQGLQEPSGERSAATDRAADEENLQPDRSGLDPATRRAVSDHGREGRCGPAGHAPMAGLPDFDRLPGHGLADQILASPPRGRGWELGDQLCNAPAERADRRHLRRSPHVAGYVH